MTAEHQIIAHYRHGDLETAVLAGLAAAGKNVDRLTAEDLSTVDEFHTGGRRGTADFAAEFAPRTGAHLLDIGSGLGGPSRYFAIEYGCRVSGIDLSEEYVAVAAELSRRLGLADRTEYRRASATELPFPAAAFDGAYMMHVGMNIADKAKLFNEVHRVLKPGGIFGIYDVMRMTDGVFSYPVPWSAQPETNFIETPATYRALLTAEGFEIVKERNRLQFAIAYNRERQAKMSASPSPLGIQIVLGATTPQKLSNMLAMFEHGVIAPVEMICRRVQVNPHAGNV